MAIESDIQGADGCLAVQFYKYLQEDIAQTLVEGRPIYREVDYIKIAVPGNALMEHDRAVEPKDKDRFPIQWAKYLNRVNEEGHYEGTPLTEWSLVSRSQAEQLRALKFYTVESIAQAGDQHIQNIGMTAGMSPYTFRDKAKSFLATARSDADQMNREEEIDQLKAENARIKAETDAKMAEMREEFDLKLSSLLAAVGEKKPKAKKAQTVEE